MKIYLIMAVRGANDPYPGIYAADMERLGHSVHFPPRDAPQDSPTGREICEVHLAAMRACDEVHVIWNVESKGSHFDLGMAYALGKKIVPVCSVQSDPPGKSYWKAVIDTLGAAA